MNGHVNKRAWSPVANRPTIARDVAGVAWAIDVYIYMYTEREREIEREREMYTENVWFMCKDKYVEIVKRQLNVQ